MDDDRALPRQPRAGFLSPRRGHAALRPRRGAARRGQARRPSRRHFISAKTTEAPSLEPQLDQSPVSSGSTRSSTTVWWNGRRRALNRRCQSDYRSDGKT